MVQGDGQDSATGSLVVGEPESETLHRETRGDPPSSAADTLTAVLERRYSCRAFRSDEVPPATMRRMFTMAQRAASWCNSQAWTVHLITGERTAAFAAALQGHVAEHPGVPDFEPPASYDGIYRERRRATGFGLYNALGVARGDLDGRARQVMQNFRFFGAPHVAVISSPKALGVYGAIDCGSYVSTLLAAAGSLDIATIAQAAIAMHADLVHDFLDIGPERNIVCAVSFGYADSGHAANSFRTERASIDDVVIGLPPLR